MAFKETIRRLLIKFTLQSFHILIELKNVRLKWKNSFWNEFQKEFLKFDK